MSKKHLVIIWGGFAGIRTFSKLKNNPNFSITLIDKSPYYLMKPIYPEVAFEGQDLEKTKFSLKDVIEPKGSFVNKWVEKVVADDNKVILEDGEEISYDYLLVATGAHKAFDEVKGLEEHGYSMCDEDHAVKLWERLQSFKWGKVLIGSAKSTFDEKSEWLKWEAPCEGPIGEGMYMLEYYLRKKGLKDKTQMTTFAPGAVFRGDSPSLASSKGIDVKLEHVVSEVKENSVVFENGEELESDLTIMIPKYRGQQFLKDSGIADDFGFVPTSEQMQHETYKNIFAAGDINARTMPKLGHIAVIEADIVIAMLKNEVGQNVKIPEFKPEVFCVMNMGGTEASVFLSDKAFGGKYHMYWHNGQNARFKRIFDWYMVKSKGNLPPEAGIEIFKKLSIFMGRGEK